mgnify:CR=1 FL=1
MSRKHFSKNWISPTHGEVTMQEIPKYIREYYNRMKEYGTGIYITIGTDSQNFDYTKEVSVIAVICEGRGGIFFYKINARDRISDVRTKLRMKTGDSLEIADELLSVLEEKEYEDVFLNTDFSIHIDAGGSLRWVLMLGSSRNPMLRRVSLIKFLSKMALISELYMERFLNWYRTRLEAGHAVLITL